MTMNPYEILGVKPTATRDEIRDAFMVLAKKYHPDVAGGGDDEKFVVAKVAYDLLSDQTSRAHYDETGFIKGDPESQIARDAQANIYRVFDELLAKVPAEKMAGMDVIGVLKRSFAKAVDNHERVIAEFADDIRRIKNTRAIIEKRMTKKKKAKGGNLFLMMIDQKEHTFLSMIENEKKPLAIAKKAIEILNDYKFAADDASVMIGFMPVASFCTTA